VFVADRICVVEVGTFDVDGGALCDGPDIGGERYGIALVKTLAAFAQRFRHRGGQSFLLFPARPLRPDGEYLGSSMVSFMFYLIFGGSCVTCVRSQDTSLSKLNWFVS
jgi:hypothetical protein